ncbi:MAG: hypothetical protein IJ729_05665, partial [Alloprevotella sp.]|nr:hypothetical protein [Alloprevotella sp.]
ETTPNGGADSTTLAADTTQNAPEAQTPSLADIVAKAKAEGANWSVDEWKEQFKQAMLAYKPAALEMDSIIKKIGTPEAQGINFDEEIKKVTAKYPDIDNLLGEFNKVAESCANGKAVLADEEWGKKLMEELGIPDL